MRLISQPSAAFMLQSAKPELHCPMTHLPDEQAREAFAGVGHTLVQLPQLSGSKRGSTQPAAHEMSGDMQVLLHLPPMQLCPGWQTVAQAPQCASSDARFAQTPLQLVRPV